MTAHRFLGVWNLRGALAGALIVGNTAGSSSSGTTNGRGMPGDSGRAGVDAREGAGDFFCFSAADANEKARANDMRKTARRLITERDDNANPARRQGACRGLASGEAQAIVSA